MGMFDNIAGLAGNADVAALAAKVGLSEAQVQQVIAALGPAAAQPGDTAENAANASGISLDKVKALIAQMGGSDSPLDNMGGMFGRG